VELKSPTTLVAAWLLVPVLVAVVSAGLGVGLRLASGLRLGALTVPAGYAAGVALAGFALGAGASGRVAALAVVALALAGPLVLAARGGLRAARPRALAGARAAAWPAAGAALAYGIGLAPLAGSGRSGVLGYVLNNDTTAHLSLVRQIADGSAERVAAVDSYTVATFAFESGYPLGTYAWPDVATVLTGVDPFHTWTPLIAVSMAMTAPIAYWLLRGLDAPPPFAAAAGGLAAAGYLPLSYLAQGGAKELLMPPTLLAAAALGAAAIVQGAGWRTFVPAAVASAAAITNLGYAALAWLGPAALVALAVLVVRLRRGGRLSAPGRRQLAAVGLFALVAVPLALPAAIRSIDFFRAAATDLRDPNEVGNLLGPLPLAETLNVWLSLDYRLDSPDVAALTWLGVALAGAAAVAGLAHAARRRDLALPLAVVTAIAGAALVYPRVSIYFESKALVVVAPALGVLSAAGVLALARARRRELRRLAAPLGAALALGVLASAAWVYAGVWNTPHERFEELAAIGERYAGRGPILVNEREYYADYLLREARPWNAWSDRQPFRELRSRSALPPTFPHTPDFDDYRPEHLHRFELLLERRRPGGSRPPGNFAPDFETRHYRVWRRTGRDPVHLPIGTDLDGSAGLRCDAPAVERLVAQARERGVPIAVSTRPGLVRAFQLDAWVAYDRVGVQPPDEFVGRRAGTGFAAGAPPLARGRHRAWIAGSYVAGVRLWAGPAPLGEARNDLGLPSQWFDLGTFESAGSAAPLSVTPLERSRLLAGSRHHELSSVVWVEPADATWTVETVEPGALRRLCGQPVDWLELPPA
jgi:hypothetical protein